ncbi:MAG TPA: CGNR zinc finger domain-containing protein [Streptosporangiaceae bacterium]|jgi:predicted RNA-binding Zn ribbon-like protein
MSYVDYLGNITLLAVEVANTGNAGDQGTIAHAMLAEHQVARPAAAELEPLRRLLREALGQIVAGDHRAEGVSTLLNHYPPDMHLSDHDGLLHLHFARDGLPPVRWIGQMTAAALAHIATGDPAVTLGRCAAAGCDRFFVDQSRNRTRRFCGGACASRTSVAAFRARGRA